MRLGMRSAVVAAGLMALVAGCARPAAIESREPSHVVVCPGIAGADPFCQRLTAMIDGLPGVSAQLWDWTVVEWTGDPSGLRNLTDYSRNQRRARFLAEQIESWRASHPSADLSLLGVSGGAGIVIFAAGDLPETFVFEQVVLISGAVSPARDLTPIIRRTRRGLFNYYSRNDRLILADGTRINGTMDRQFCPSCGYCGLEKPSDPDVAARLFQLKWRPEFLLLGNDGGHLGGLSAEFVRRFVLPLFADGVTPPAGWQRA